MSITTLAVNNAHELWQAALGELQTQMTRATFDTWLKSTHGLSLGGDCLVIGVPTTYAKEWLEHRLVGSVRETVARIHGAPIECSFVVSQPIQERADRTPLFEQTARSANGNGNGHGAASWNGHTPRGLPTPTLNPRYTFENFVVGTGNRLAHAAAQAVAEHPATRYNPLFIYGGVGLGKTHLLHAIGHAAAARGAKVCSVSSEKFTNDLIEAIRNQSTEEFRAVYRAADVLLVDDIHFIAGKESTQEEFFHTFNAIHGTEGQVVLTSDRPPHSITTLEDRLRSRFQWGLQVDIEPPDLETRIAILRAKSDRQSYHIPDAVIELVANAVQHNVRELEGALNRVLAFAQCNRLPLGVDTARQALADLMMRRDPPSFGEVLAAVAEYYRLTEDDLTGRSRTASVAEPRQVAMYLIREDADASLPAIGAALGGRDHTTVMHGCEKIGHLLEQDAKLRRSIMQIRDRLYGP